MMFYVSLWFLVGLATAGYLTYQDIKGGVDYTIKDLLLVLWATILGPICLILVLYNLYGDTIVIKGKGKE
jgi:hypothetical protein